MMPQNTESLHLQQALLHLNLTQGIPAHQVSYLNHEVKDLPDKKRNKIMKNSQCYRHTFISHKRGGQARH